MEAKELYVGKLYYQIEHRHSDNPFKKVIQFDPANWYRIGECIEFLEDFEPIPLTEEFFIKNGDVDENGNFYIKHPEGNDLRFYLVDGFVQLAKSYHCPIMNFDHITTVHLFQNLIFALTGTELTINLCTLNLKN